MKISVKLILGFAVMIILMVFMILMSKNSMTEINGKVEELAKDRFPKTVEANNIINQINLQARAVRNIIIFGDEETTKKELARIKDSRESIANSMNKLQGTIKSDAGKEKLANVDKAQNEYIPVIDKVIENAKVGDYEAAKGNLITTLRKLQQKYFDEVEALIKFQYDLVEKSTVTAAETFESSVTMLYITIFSGVIIAVLVGLWIILSITKPLNRAVKAAESIASGDLDIDVKTNSKDETGLLLNSMERMTGSIKELMGETNTLIDSVNNGKLDIRGKAEKYKGSWRDLVGSVNSLVDSFVAPINVTAEYVDRISKGDIPPKITDNYKGDFNEIKNNINACIDVMSSLLTDTNILIESTKDGKLDTRADSRKYIGGWNKLVSGINELINEFVGPINVTAEYVDRISKGDIPPKITDEYKGDFNEIKNNLNACIDVMSGLLSETTLLIDSATAGKLDIRANNMKFTGGWNTLVKSINELIDAFVKPINVTAEYIDRISKGDIPMKITDEYRGDFNEIKNNINLCIDSVNNLVNDAQSIAEEAINGKLRSRADESRHNGDFRAIMRGFNNSLDTIVGLLNNLPIPVMGIDSEFTIQYMNEFAASVDGKTGSEMTGKKCYDHFRTSHCHTTDCACYQAMNFNGIATNETDAHPGNLNLEISYTGMPIKDASDRVIGAFEVVTDLTELKNNLRKAETAIEEANNAKKETENTMDTILRIKKYQDTETETLIKILEQLAEGDFSFSMEFSEPDEVTQECYIMLNKIVDAVNKFKNSVIDLQDDSFRLAEFAKEGMLDKRADVSKHKGDFRNVVIGMNDMLDKLLDPINEGAKVLEVMATGDLTKRVTGEYKGGHAMIKESINAVGNSLSALINQVMEMAQSISSITLEMSSTADTMAAGSQEQAAQADDVSSAVEEMSRTITENAMSAHKTVEEAEKNKNIANEGGTIVEQTVQKMKDIANVVSQSAENMEKLGDSSTKIGEIISVIDDIADQTNLLALNAAIEAARAGEQGRGFAVVADEVRKLAERTTEATKQIAGMIKGIQVETQNAVKVMNVGNKEVTNGIQLADKAGKSLHEIVVSSQDVQMMINQIAAASEEQSSTSEEIAKNVQSINQVTNESAKRIQDIAESSENLAKMIETLNSLLNQFKVSDDAGSGTNNKLIHAGNGNGHGNGHGNGSNYSRKQNRQLAGKAFAEAH